MYKRILVAIDDSFMTEQVLDTAIELSKSCGATLGLLHALDETMFGHHPSAENLLPNSVGKAEFRMRKGAGAFLEKAAQRVTAAGVEAELKLVESETKHISDMLVEAGQGVEQRRFAGVRVAGEGHDQLGHASSSTLFSGRRETRM